MKVSKKDAKRYDWDEVKTLNYKLGDKSVVIAEFGGPHGKVSTKDVERVYYILDGAGEFIIGGDIVNVEKGDVITIPPHTEFDYQPVGGRLKVVLFMELWDN